MTTAIGVARVPLSCQLAIEQTMSWPAILWEREQTAYAGGWDDARSEEYERGWVSGSAETAQALSGSTDERDGDSPEWTTREYWSGYYAGYEHADKRAAGEYARGLVEGGAIGQGIDPTTGAPFEDPERPMPLSRAFELGRQVERRRWERINEGGEAA